MGSHASARLGYGILFQPDDLPEIEIKDEDDMGDNIVWRYETELEKMGLEIMYNGNSIYGAEEPEPIGIVIKETYIHTYDEWEFEELDIPEINAGWKVTLTKACEMMGLETKRPKWLLCSHYG